MDAGAVYVANSEDVALLGKLLNLLAVRQLRLMRRLILLAILVEKIDNVEALVLVVAYKDLESKSKKRSKHLIEIVELPAAVDIEATECLLKLRTVDLTLRKIFAHNQDLLVVIGR